MESNTSAQTGWIKIWISLGLVATLLGLIVPSVLARNAKMEVQRYQECAAGTRQDCQPSIVWVLYESALQQEGGRGLLMENIRTDAKVLE